MMSRLIMSKHRNWWNRDMLNGRRCGTDGSVVQGECRPSGVGIVPGELTMLRKLDQGLDVHATFMW